MNFGILSGLVTAMLIVAFLGGVAWAWSSRRERDFEEAAHLPLEDDSPQGEPRP